MASRKSSILKPRKAREPLQDLNQLLPNNDDEDTTTTTGLAKRRVSFASMNKVKEFESAAECVTLLNTPAYDERFSISSDSCQSSVLSSSHTDPQKVVTKRDDIAVEEEIELTETVGGKIYESEIKSCIDSSMEYTTPCPTNIRQSLKMTPYEIVNHENIDCDTSCMETTEVITNNTYATTLISQMCTGGGYNEETAASECQNMEVSPYREVQPVSRKSIFHLDQYIPTRKSIFHPTASQPTLDSLDKDNLHANRTGTEENIVVDMSLVTMEECEEKSLGRMSINKTFVGTQDEPRRSIFCLPALNLVKPEIPQTTVPVGCELFNEAVVQLESQDIRIREVETQNVDANQTKLPEEDERETSDHPSRLEIPNNKSSSITDGSTSPPKEGANLSTGAPVEYIRTVNSNKVRSKSISNLQVNVINNTDEEVDHNVPKLRLSMPATKTEYNELKQRDHSSFTDVKSGRKEDADISRLKEHNNDGVTHVDLMSSVLANKSIISSENVEQPAEVSQEPTRSKKRLSSEMLGETEEEVTSAKRRSTSITGIGEIAKEIAVREEDISFDKQNGIVDFNDIQEPAISTKIEKQQEFEVCQSRSSLTVAENILVETCSNLRSSICSTTANEPTEINEITRAQRSPSIDENAFSDDRAIQESPNALKNSAQSVVKNHDAGSDLESNIDSEVHTIKSPIANGNNDHEVTVEPPTSVTCARKSFAAVSISSKSSLTDELSTKERSIEIRSDNDSDRLSTQVHSTPFRKRSSKSVGGQSVLEDELIDSLNNPSIIVNIGDSFSHRSFDLSSENVSSPETRDGSGGELAVKMNSVENVPSGNVSKVSFISDWLMQNRTGKNAISAVNSCREIKNASANEIENAETSRNESVAFDEKIVISESSQAVERTLPEDQTEVTERVVSDLCQVVEKVLSKDQPEDVEDVFKETEKVISDSCQAVERLLPRDQTKPAENTFEEVKETDISLSVKINITQTETEKIESSLLGENLNPAVEEMLPREQNSLYLNTSSQPVTVEVPLQQNDASVPELEKEAVLTSVDPINDVVDNEQECKGREIERIDRDEEINLDLMDISADIDSDEDEGRGVMEAETSLNGLNNTSVSETTKNEVAIQNLQKEILKKILLESRKSEWRRMVATNSEWIFRISEFEELAKSAYKTSPAIAAKLIPSLVIKIVPGSTNCSASFKLLQSPPDNYCEIMEIGIRALKYKCQKKMKTICRTVENVPCLLKSVRDDVVWMMKFVNDLKRIGGWQDVRYKNCKASFYIASYKNLISFQVTVDLSSLKMLSVKDVQVKPHVGKIDSNCVLRAFSESGRDYDFFSKFVKQLNNIFDS